MRTGSGRRRPWTFTSRDYAASSATTRQTLVTSRPFGASGFAARRARSGSRSEGAATRTGLLAALAYVLLLAIVALGVPLGLNLSARINDEVRSQAEGQADLVAATAADLLTPSRRRDLAVLAHTAAAAVRGRVLIVDRTGIVLADSAVPPELGSSYAGRPEIARALGGHRVQVQRASSTLGEKILATAVPIIRNRATAGAVRVTQSVSAVNAAVRRVELGLALIGAIVLALGLAVGVVIAGQIARPLGRLERIARRVAGGDQALARRSRGAASSARWECPSMR